MIPAFLFHIEILLKASLIPVVRKGPERSGPFFRDGLRELCNYLRACKK